MRQLLSGRFPGWNICPKSGEIQFIWTSNAKALECVWSARDFRKPGAKFSFGKAGKNSSNTHFQTFGISQGWKAVQAHGLSEHCVATACCHLWIGARARHKPVFPFHRADSRWITHSSGQTLEKGEKQVNCSNRKGGDTQVPRPSTFQNHGVITTGRDTRKWKLSHLEPVQFVWNIWVFIARGRQSDYSAHPKSERGVLMATAWNQAETCFAYWSPSPPCQAPQKWLHVGIISDIFTGTNFFMPTTAWCPPPFELVKMFTAEFFFPCGQLQRGNHKEKHQKHQLGPGYMDKFVRCRFLSTWT